MGTHYAIGVDLGGTNVRAALVDTNGNLVKRFREAAGDNPAEVLRNAVAELRRDGVAGIGIGVAGVVDRAKGCIQSSPNLHMLEGVCFDSLELGYPVKIENDAEAAARGELWCGMGQEFDSFVLMTLGTGIGGAYVYKGQVLDLPFEVGHISVEASGQKCPCGNIGCLENYASARAIISEARNALEEGRYSMLRDCCKGNIYKITPQDIYNIAFEGDAFSRELLRNAGRYLGVGMSSIINLLAPEAIVLAGGLTGAWDIYVTEALNETNRRVLKPLKERAKVVRSSLGVDDAGVLGAAALVLHGKEQ